MKKTILFLSFATIVSFFTSCDDSTTIEKPTDTTNDLLKGEWVWIRTSGGFAGIIQTPNDNNLLRILNFSDKTMTVSENQMPGNPIPLPISSAVPFSLSNKKSFLKGQNTDFIIFDLKNCTKCGLSSEYDFDFKGKDTLVLQEDVNDGFEQLYVRKSEGYKSATYLGIDPKLCPTPCCGGFLFNIDGLNYQASQFPAGVVFDVKKVPQKVTVKFTVNTTYACKPQPINLTELIK
jgi:preprotein translocase subunit YajC